MGRAGASRGAASPLASIDPSLQRQQVLLASLPDQPPEVHIACLYPQQAVLSLREASVGGNSQVALGGERNVSLAEAASVEASDRVVSVLGRDGRPMVQLHFETAEDERNWARGLRAVLAANGGRPTAGASGAHGAMADEVGGVSEELPALQARSHELQSKISGLEAVSDRRDKQLQKMMQRLDGAMQMLSAVQEMCQQQRKVVYSQRVAIVELRKDLGENPGMEPDGADARAGEADDEDEGASEGDEGHYSGMAGAGPGKAEMAEKAEKMLSLMQQADEMQRMLQQLEASGGAGDEDDDDAEDEEDDEDGDQDGGAADDGIGSAGDAATMLQQLLGSLGGGMEDDPEAQDAISALGRLRQLEEEKEKFEGLLEAKKAEHEQMLSRHNEMKAMMAALGVTESAGDDSDDDA